MLSVPWLLAMSPTLKSVPDVNVPLPCIVSVPLSVPFWPMLLKSLVTTAAPLPQIIVPDLTKMLDGLGPAPELLGGPTMLLLTVTVPLPDLMNDCNPPVPPAPNA